MSLPSIIPNLIRLARNAARADAAGLWLLHSSGTHLENVFCDGLPEEYIKLVRKAPLGLMSCGRAVVEKRPRVVPDILCDPEFGDSQNSPVRACFSVPVIGQTGKVYGSMACHYKRVHSPSQYDIERNEIFALLIAFALDEAGRTPQTELAAD
jgi:GAF domain-containing protein